LRKAAPDRPVTLEPDGKDRSEHRICGGLETRGFGLAKLPNLKVIFSLGAGVDHVFATPACRMCRSCVSFRRI
jgi:glyoxylate/hydroxypyruvate reductase A